MSHSNAQDTTPRMETNEKMWKNTTLYPRRGCSYHERDWKPSRQSDSSTNAAPTRVAYNSAPAQYTLKQERQNMICQDSDLDETVCEVARSFFEEYLLPPSPLSERNDLKLVLHRLRGAGEIDQKGHWRQLSVSNRDQLDDCIFQGLELLAEHIIEASEIFRETTIDFKSNPAVSVTFRARKNTSRSACYGVRKSVQLDIDPDTNKLQPKWLDIAIPGELRRNGDGHFTDDAKLKVLWSMKQIMRVDPRRRFVIGFTIEDFCMQFWYCSRSDVFVSEPFNMLTEHDILVDFILRTSFASEQQLGWDSSIMLHQPSLSTTKKPNELQYDITVYDQEEKTSRTFRTQRLIADSTAKILRGRGTRVWEVRELNEDGEEVGKPCVLKDSWVDSDRDREGDILAKIRQAAAKRGPQDAVKRRVDRSLLTVITYGDVRCNELVDKTLNRAEIPQNVHAKIIWLSPRKCVSAQSSIARPSVTQHRIVFKEICKTIREVPSLAEAFDHLIHISNALKCLHELGWVHRDISSGNILVFNGVAKLADLEYAKHESNSDIHDNRTGTPYFMSVEVDCTCYLVSSNSEPRISAPTPAEDHGEDMSTASAFDVIDGFFLSSTKDSSSGSELFSDIPFKYNPLHDMESLMWLGWFLLISPRLVSIGLTPTSKLDAFMITQQRLADTMFVDKSARTMIMTTHMTFRQLIAKAALHGQIETVAQRLLECHSKLREVYKSAEKDLLEPIPFTVAKSHGLYKNYSHNLSKIARILRQEDIIVAPDQNACDRLRKEMRLEHVLEAAVLARTAGGTTSKRSRGLSKNDVTIRSSERSPKKQKMASNDDRHDDTVAPASRSSRRDVDSSTGTASAVHPSGLGSPSSDAPTNSKSAQ